MTATSKLERRHEVFIAALLTHPTISAAAQQAGISEATGLRWLKRPDVSEAARAARRQVVEAAIAHLQCSASEAVEALRRNLTPETPRAIQVRAAVAVLQFATQAVELVEVLERVDRLEAALAHPSPPRQGGRRYG
jgi:hypothetical protein